jgi:hypothetical protein
MVVGICISLVFAAAALDAAMWSHGMERHRLEGQVRALEAENEALRGELRRAELDRDLHELLYETDRLMRDPAVNGDALVLPEVPARPAAAVRTGCDDPL